MKESNLRVSVDPRINKMPHPSPVLRARAMPQDRFIVATRALPDPNGITLQTLNKIRIQM